MVCGLVGVGSLVCLFVRLCVCACLLVCVRVDVFCVFVCSCAFACHRRSFVCLVIGLRVGLFV